MSSLLRRNIIARTIVYYIVLFGITTLLYQVPAAKAVLHASLDALMTNNGVPGLGTSPKNAPIIAVDSASLSWSVGAAMVGAVLLSIPVAWIYSLTRQKKGFQPSVMETLILLPALVAGIVVFVKYSLALAFGLAGIVAAVRFRTSLEDSKDAVYIFLATAVGLAAGVQLPMAAVISVV